MVSKIASRLVQLRGKRTREEVAQSIGVSVSAIAMYENGLRVPKDDIKIKLASYYCTSVQEIFFD